MTTTTTIYVVYYIDHNAEIVEGWGFAGTFSSNNVAYKAACVKQIEWLTVNYPSNLNDWLEDHPIPGITDPISTWQGYLSSINPSSICNKGIFLPQCKAYYVEATILDKFPSKGNSDDKENDWI